MKYLLDTHTIIWFFEANNNLGSNANQLIATTFDHIYISYVSVWETAIKKGKGKLLLNYDLDEYVNKAGFTLLGIELAHINATTSLPHIHRDPFDRLLIAQALSENLTLITGDKNVLQYPRVKLLDARK